MQRSLVQHYSKKQQTVIILNTKNDYEMLA